MISIINNPLTRSFEDLEDMATTNESRRVVTTGPPPLLPPMPVSYAPLPSYNHVSQSRNEPPPPYEP